MPAPELTVQTPGDPLANATTTNTASAEPAPPLYIAKHNGGGRWKVWVNEDDGDWFSDFVASGEGAKEAAQAEADRLNAGGEPFVKPDETPATTNTATPAAAEQPATRSTIPVLTAEGWLVPDLPSRKE